MHTNLIPVVNSKLDYSLECNHFQCTNGGLCSLDGACTCLPDFEGEHCESGSSVSRQVRDWSLIFDL